MIPLEPLTKSGTPRCQALKRICPECGTRFKREDEVCQNCGAKREQCNKTAITGDTKCRSHVTGRAFSLYSKLAATLTDSALEELVQRDDRSLDQEYALAKVALSAVLDSNRKDEMTPERLMSLVRSFFYIAEKKKNIESGQVLNISWNDDLVNSLRTKIGRLVRGMKEIIEEYVPEESRMEAKEALYRKTKTAISLISSPDSPSNYKSSDVEDE